MAWEWHARQRASNGRYVCTPGRNATQLHLRMRTEQAEVIRNMAVRHKMSLSDYVCWAVYTAEQADRHERKRFTGDHR